ncbi:MAG: hypothetical protein KBT01_06550, partial [Clostridiales bacterium]|nr:hypothetical protein [Candidatus Blautia equi]
RKYIIPNNTTIQIIVNPSPAAGAAAVASMLIPPVYLLFRSFLINTMLHHTRKSRNHQVFSLL